MKYYHGSNALYDFPSLEFIQSPTDESGVAAKVVLGYYVTPMQHLAASLGTYVYEIVLDERSLIEELPIGEMIADYRAMEPFSWSEQLAFYLNKHKWYYDRDVDMVNIVEVDGRVGESFIVNIDAIASFRRIK